MNRLPFFLLITVLSILSCNKKSERNFKIMELNYHSHLVVIQRHQWGWQPIPDSLANHQINKITIHHGGVDFPADKDPVEYLCNFQSWCRSEKGWIDIPYHFIIDLQGKIYEARPINLPGDTNTDYDPTGHALICVLGIYENQKINPNQLSSIINLSAFLVDYFDVSVDEIKGHKDYTETACPGKDLYKYLKNGEIQNRVKERLNDKTL
jgi:hypothetical protein